MKSGRFGAMNILVKDGTRFPGDKIFIFREVQIEIGEFYLLLWFFTNNEIDYFNYKKSIGKIRGKEQPFFTAICSNILNQKYSQAEIKEIGKAIKTKNWQLLESLAFK